MARLNPKRKPQFFWQGMLILLPVILMAGFGFWAILRQRSAVEQDARARAREIVQSFPDDFGRAAAEQLIHYDASSYGWLIYVEFGSAAWPADGQEFLADTNERAIVSNAVAALKSVFPDWKNGPPPIFRFFLETNGEVLGLDPMPPRPPVWLLDLSAAQYRAWTKLVMADNAAASSSDISTLVDAFEATKPPVPARMCAEFVRLRSVSRTAPPGQAVDQLTLFAGQCYSVASESGVPLSTLAIAEALRRARDGKPIESLWRALHDQVAAASPGAPYLLDAAVPLAAKDAQLAESIRAMRILLAERLSEEELADAVRHSGKLSSVTTTTFWMEGMGRRWFCLLEPGRPGGAVAVMPSQWNSGGTAMIAPSYTQINCYPEPLVKRGFANAVADANISLPPYFGLSLDLDGQTIALSSDQPTGEVLAERQFRMYLPRKDMLSRQQFTLQLHLADRGLLYAKQRQLQFIFGSLIGFSALSAFIGFFAARRSFYQQRELGELKTNFVSSVSHELRAPIAAVRLMAENLERGKIPDAPRQNEYFRFIVQECRRLSSLIENVLDFSRIEQGRKQYEFEETDLVALAQTTVKLMEPYAAEKGVCLKLETDGAIESEIDGRALQQALVNLIDNAVKHSPKGESVAVELRRRNDAIELSVTDHGPGIPRGEQERIFERFYRLGSELRRETQGVGIGLSVVKHIVEAHHGRVLLESEVGKGSRFTIQLPLER